MIVIVVVIFTTISPYKLGRLAILRYNVVHPTQHYPPTHAHIRHTGSGFPYVYTHL